MTEHGITSTSRNGIVRLPWAVLHLQQDDVLRLMRAIDTQTATLAAKTDPAVNDGTEAQALDRLQAILEAQAVADGG